MPSPIINYDSPWPKKLKAMKAGDILLIPLVDLDRTKIQTLVGNCNYRLKGRMTWRFDGVDEVHGMVTCTHRGRGVPIDARKPGPKPKVKAAAGAFTSTEVMAVKTQPFNRPQSMLVVEKINGDHEVIHAIDRAHYDDLLARIGSDPMVHVVNTYVLTNVKKREVSWKDETAPTKG